MINRDQWRGSATVEAAIIMPIFLILLVVMLMFAIFVYEKAAMRSVCNEVAAEGAAIWQRGSSYMADYYSNQGQPSQETQDKVHIYSIYASYFSNLIDIEQSKKLELLKEYLTQEVVRHSFILTEKDVETDVQLSSVIIHKKLVVSAKADYNLPFYSDTSDVSAECVISWQTELVRTIDLAADMLDGPMAGIKEKYGKVIEKLQELISKVKIEK